MGYLYFLSFRYCEYACCHVTRQVRAGWRSQQLPVLVRMRDKDTKWEYDNGLRSIIPTALVAGILGYPFVLPDMIGGNGYGGAYRVSCLMTPTQQPNVHVCITHGVRT